MAIQHTHTDIFFVYMCESSLIDLFSSILQCVNAETREIEDNFRIIKKQSDKFVDVSQIMSRFAGMAVDEFNTERDVEL